MSNMVLNKAIKFFDAKRYGDAKEIFLSLANKNTTAQYYLGAIYRMGLGTRDDQKEAFSWFLKAAKQGHKESQFLVGCAYITFLRRETELVKVNYDRFEEKSKNDLSVWQDELPYYELHGIGVEPSDSEGFKWIEASAKQGYVEAQVALGDIYDWGIGVKEDKYEMRKWYKKAALQRSATAYRNLALHSYIYDEDFPKTIELLLKAYKLGDLRAAFTIGRRYEKAEDKFRNLQEAYKWYKIAGDECNHVEALIKLGDFYQEGKVVDKCIERSIFYYKRALEVFDTISDTGYCNVYDKLFKIYKQGYKEAILDKDIVKYLVCLAESNDEARLELRSLYESGYDVGEKYITFFSLYDKAIKGDKQAQIKCGYKYIQYSPMDDLVEKNALNWYMNDAINENPDAQFLLSRIHFGRNNKADYSFWLKKAADNEHSRAQFELGLYYECERMEDAIKYIKLASEENILAQLDLGYKYAHGVLVDINYKEAYMFYQKVAKSMMKIQDNSELKGINRIKFRYNAANDEAELLAHKGDVDAQLYMGCLYQYGFEVKRNLNKAIYWYEKASKQESEEANLQLSLLSEERNKMYGYQVTQ